jgi:MbtH protein
MTDPSLTADDDDDDPFEEYAVVRNIYDDYSIWPTIKALPAGWEQVGIQGAKAVCLGWIENNWSGPSLQK